MFTNLLAHPLTLGRDIDDPGCTELGRSLVRNKSFLRQVYKEWYEAIAALLPLNKDPVLELGSGGLVIMREPWVTSWSRLLYSKLHHEPIRLPWAPELEKRGET